MVFTSISAMNVIRALMSADLLDRPSSDAASNLMASA